MTFTEAAAQVLRLVGKPLHYKEIADVAIEKNLLSHVGKSPEVTMGARLAALVKKAEKDNPLVRVKPGVFALREWDKKTIDEGLADRTPALQLIANNGAEPSEDGAEEDEVAPAEAPSDPEATEDEEAPPPPLAAHVPVSDGDDEAGGPDAEEQARAEIAASANQLFEAEEDDDEPIFGEAAEDEEADRAERESSSRRRRRRRRRRPPPSAEQKGGDDLPTYTVSDAPLDGAEVEATKPSRARENDRKDNDRGRREQVTLEGLSGEPLADALASLIAGHDRNNGLVTLHKLAEAAHRKGRLSGDSQHTPALLAAVARADNLRRSSAGQRPRFRLSGNRIGLTDWLLDSDLQRAEKEVFAAVQRYREVARKSLLTRLQQLPQKAVGELLLLLAERLGISGLSPVRRPGASGAELHLAGVLASVKADVRVALLIRRDGREVGREQVIDLRGALHHYGPAAAGWIMTTGQVLSGAREEAAVPGAAPITLVDGAGLVKLCEEHGVAVVGTRLSIPVPDGELFDALRSS